MASAVDCGDEEMQILVAPENNVTLNDTERMKLITVIKEKGCLWGSEKFTRQDKQAAFQELEEAFNLRFTSNELLSVWKSLRASMLRVFKKTRREPAMLFLKPTLDKACEKAENGQRRKSVA